MGTELTAFAKKSSLQLLLVISSPIFPPAHFFLHSTEINTRVSQKFMFMLQAYMSVLWCLWGAYNWAKAYMGTELLNWAAEEFMILFSQSWDSHSYASCLCFRLSMYSWMGEMILIYCLISRLVVETTQEGAKLYQELVASPALLCVRWQKRAMYEKFAGFP